MAGSNSFSKFLNKFKPVEGSASEEELKQREATRARINSMSEEQKKRVQADSQQRTRDSARASGFGTVGGAM